MKKKLLFVNIPQSNLEETILFTQPIEDLIDQLGGCYEIKKVDPKKNNSSAITQLKKYVDEVKFVDNPRDKILVIFWVSHGGRFCDNVWKDHVFDSDAAIAIDQLSQFFAATSFKIAMIILACREETPNVFVYDIPTTYLVDRMSKIFMFAEFNKPIGIPTLNTPDPKHPTILRVKEVIEILKQLDNGYDKLDNLVSEGILHSYHTGGNITGFDTLDANTVEELMKDFFKSQETLGDSFLEEVIKLYDTTGPYTLRKAASVTFSSGNLQEI